MLGTPDEQTWPDVVSFPDYKASFPKWSRNYNKPIAAGLEDENGEDLLNAMLIYDPAGRISAKQACSHPYFGMGAAEHSGRNAKINGYLHH